MTRIKSSFLRDKVLSANDIDFINFLEENVLKLDKSNKDCLVDNLAEVNDLDFDSIKVGIARVNRLEYSFNSLTHLINILTIIITILVFALELVSDDSIMKNFTSWYLLFLAIALLFYGKEIIKYRKKVSTAIYFKSLLEIQLSNSKE